MFKVCPRKLSLSISESALSNLASPAASGIYVCSFKNKRASFTVNSHKSSGKYAGWTNVIPLFTCEPVTVARQVAFTGITLGQSPRIIPGIWGEATSTQSMNTKSGNGYFPKETQGSIIKKAGSCLEDKIIGIYDDMSSLYCFTRNYT